MHTLFKSVRWTHSFELKGVPSTMPLRLKVVPTDDFQLESVLCRFFAARFFCQDCMGQSSVAHLCRMDCTGAE